MKKTISGCILSFLLAALVAAPCFAEDDTFDIVRFQIEGNTLLPDVEVQRAVAPQVGAKRVYGDIQKALEALERAYRAQGFSTVQVYVPEQELTGGVVRILVTEGVIGKVLISGNMRFDERNIRASLPSLREGRAPNLRQMSENIQLSNDSPAKQIEVSLGVSEEEGKVDAKVVVAEENPQRAFMTADSTGTAASGRNRVGLAYQHANLFNRDHTLTLGYTTSPDHRPANVKVDIFSVGYRIPFYALGDSLDLIYGKSNVNTPISSTAFLGIVGKGDVFGARWNHHFARRGEYTSKLVFGLDYKYINARCATGVPPNVEPDSIDPPTPRIASCIPYTTRPVSLTYSGQRQSPGQVYDYNIGIAHNLPLGTNYTNLDGNTDRYSYLTSGNRRTRDDFNIVRLGGSYLKAFQSDWQLRFAANSQYGGNPLVAAEQLGLAGSTAVRGFTERAAATDSGYFVSSEIYTPDLAQAKGWRGSLRALAFYDFAHGFNHNVAGDSLTPGKISVASVGAGLRYSLGKDFSLRFDLAQVVDAGPANTKQRGDWRGHFNAMFAF
jgi:hemolysin activation/secretion protein